MFIKVHSENKRGKKNTLKKKKRKAVLKKVIKQPKGKNIFQREKTITITNP